MKFLVRIKIVAILLLLVGFSTLLAQQSNISQLSIGMKHGINLSKINFDPPVSQGLMTGYTGGLAIKYISEVHAGILAEFNISQRGWTEKLDSTRSYKRRLNYFEIPILTHFIFGSSKTKGFLNIGPDLSFYRSGKEDFHLLTAGDTALYYQRKLDNEFELGLIAGAGIMQVTPIGDFQFEFRFHYGLQNIFTTDVQTNLAKSQNQLYGITVTYFFIRKDFKKGKGS